MCRWQHRRSLEVGSMLPPYIIEQIRRREEDLRKQQQPQIELPLPSNLPRPSPPERHDDDRGVVIIDL
jgi:hypothetical protein